MRPTVLLLVLFLWNSYAHAHEFIFKNGKKIQGSIIYEDSAIFRILDSSGIEMRLRKSELNFSAMETINVPLEAVSEPTAQSVPAPEQPKRTSRVYTNRDIRTTKSPSFVAPDPESEQAWLKSLSKLEREFVRLQGACRGAGGGPNLSKILRTHTYEVKGKKVKVTAYWADPANIEDAKRICRKAIQTEDELQQARKQFQEYKQRKQSPSSGRMERRL